MGDVRQVQSLISNKPLGLFDGAGVDIEAFRKVSANYRDLLG